MKLSAIDLNLLLVFDAVMAEQSIARAAKKLHVTPPAVSNALVRLREALGDPVVTRSGRGIVPTRRALELAPAIRRALLELDQAIHGKAFDPKTADPRITLAVADAGQLARLPRLTSALATAMPRARLRVVHIDTMVALGGVGGTEVDVAIGVSHPGPGLHRQKIYDERFVVVARADHPRVGERLGKRALAEEAHLDVHVAFGQANKSIAAAYASAGVTRTVSVIVPNFAAAVAVVASTELLATIPASVVAVLGPPLGVRVVAAPLEVPPLPMHMTWHERTHHDPALRLFRELVVSSILDSRG